MKYGKRIKIISFYETGSEIEPTSIHAITARLEQAPCIVGNIVLILGRSYTVGGLPVAHMPLTDITDLR